MVENIDEILAELILAQVANQKNLEEEHHNKYQKIPNSIFFHQLLMDLEQDLKVQQR